MGFSRTHFDLTFTLKLVFLFSKSILLPVDVCKIASRVANSADPDKIPRSTASDLGLHYMLRPVFPNMKSKYGYLLKLNPLRNNPGSAPEKSCLRGLGPDHPGDCT